MTGAGSGMGAATARLLTVRSAAVTVVGRRADKLHAVVAQIPARRPSGPTLPHGTRSAERATGTPSPVRRGCGRGSA
ncbi:MULTISPECIES: hypothetical protein [unclassified Streptomyces]|uniref:hypothetical protein n=1 Tax=Streptomyces TaxID=1883 RepID=UPI000D144D7B